VFLERAKKKQKRNQTKKKNKYFCVFSFIRKTERITKETKMQKRKM
jgi:hypothetical protein